MSGIKSHNPYQRAVHIGGAVLGTAAVVAVGVSADRNFHQPVSPTYYFANLPNPNLVDGEYTVYSDCAAESFCPLRSLTINVNNGQIIHVDATYQSANRQSHSRNTPAVARLSNDAITHQSVEGVDLVTGATATSTQFVNSLQAAINAAREGVTPDSAAPPLLGG
jgi:uncharacterized protein with FMN-binding domain